MAGTEKPLILFSPLDWGLGHTSRSIPLIKLLSEEGFEVVVACNSSQKLMLEQEFPLLEYVHLPGYGIVYGKTVTSTRLRLLHQLTKILTGIKSERRWLDRFLTENPVKMVISDNRYGLYSSKTRSVIITHQLSVCTAMGNFADKIAGRFIQKFISKFNECWVPDFYVNGMAGRLSHPLVVPDIPLHYLGCFSRFEPCEQQTPTRKFLFVLSGPEPQRTVFENIIIRELKAAPRACVVVRGLPEDAPAIEKIPGVDTINHADSAKMNELICDSECVVCRPGYTSIMDILKLKKNALVVPTPGQGEQIYLARFLSRKNYVASLHQKKFSLKKVERIVDEFNFQLPTPDMELYKRVVRNVVQNLKACLPKAD